MSDAGLRLVLGMLAAAPIAAAVSWGLAGFICMFPKENRLWVFLLICAAGWFTLPYAIKPAIKWWFSIA